MYADALLLLTATATAAAGGAGVGAPAPAWWAPLHGTASLDHYVGSGTFIADRHADNPYYASFLSAAPSWSLTDDLRVMAELGFTYEWTRLVTPCHPASGPRAAGAPTADCSDAEEPAGYRHDFTDLTLSVRHARLWDPGPAQLSGWASVALPTSRTSRATDNVTTLGVGGAARARWSALSVNLSFGALKFFPLREAQVVAEQDVLVADDGTPVGRCASFRTASCIALSGFVASWRLQTTLSLTVTVPWVEGLSATASVGYLYDRRHGRDADALRSPRVDGDGDPVVRGVNASNSTTGNVEVSYSLDDHFSLAIGLFSLQPARTADGHHLRFPFYDFVSPANNYTAWYLSGGVSL